jgi:hypothetical protein
MDILPSSNDFFGRVSREWRLFGLLPDGGASRLAEGGEANVLGGEAEYKSSSVLSILGVPPPVEGMPC